MMQKKKLVSWVGRKVTNAPWKVSRILWGIGLLSAFSLFISVLVRHHQERDVGLVFVLGLVSFLYIRGLHRALNVAEREWEALKEDARVRSSDHQNEMDRVHLLREIVFAINATSSDEAAIQVTLNGVCMFIDWPIGHAYHVVRDVGTRYVSSKIWQINDAFSYSSFRGELDSTVVDGSEGMPGWVSSRGKAHFVTKGDKDASRLFHCIVEKYGFSSIVAFPVMIGEEVVSVLEFYSPEERVLDSKTLESLSIVGILLGRALERNKHARLMEDQRQKMVTTSKMSALGEMAGGIAHEINNPLAIIHAYSNQILDLLDDELMDKDQIRKRASKIESTAMRIAKIISGLRAFSRDGSSDKPQLVSVEKLVNETLDFCRERFVSHGIDLLIEPMPEGLSFECRETEISQVLLNLLNNAHDAVEQLVEKWVRIEVKRDLNGYIVIRVVDSGNGISPEIREKLFQPFFTTKEVGRGTGLGLSVSQGIVKGHKGELIIDGLSAHTCFVLRLPESQGIRQLKTA
jgi:signal transduction histidine kinase